MNPQIISSAGRNRHGKRLVRCRCKCGEIFVAIRSRIECKRTHSCGCLRREKSRINGLHRRTHGQRGSGQNRTSTYISYGSAKGRCCNLKDPSYDRYGGRGIEFRFDSFEEFLACLGPRPRGKTLDRFPNNDGHYEPGNVRWATGSEQRRNQRRMHDV